ncbi:MAG: Gfo/Idh/MocA family protein, partial [bacterium]
MTIRIALLGCGRVAQHYKIFLEPGILRKAQLIGVCDLHEGRATAMSANLGVPKFSQSSDLLSTTNPDPVIIATPSGLHYEHTREALLHDCHVLVEKPAAMTPSEIVDNDQLARKRGLMYSVAFQNRLNPAVRLLEETVKQQRFGRIVSVAVRLRWCREQSYYEDGWHGKWSSDGGVINQQAIHHMDVLQWLCGPVTSVAASMANRLNRLEAEDTMVAVCRLEGGGLATIEATTGARPRDFEASLTVTGELGTARIGGVALNQVEEWDFAQPLPQDAEAKSRHSQEVPNCYGLSHGPLLQ